MNLRRLAAFTAALTCVSAAAATEVASYTGKENFQRLCAACHGPLGRGDGPVASALSTEVPNLTTIRARNDGAFPRAVLRNIIDGRWRIDAHGTRQMPVWGYEFWISEGAGDFSEVQVRKTLDELLDYIETLQVDPES